jgi:hypothetical protein
MREVAVSIKEVNRNGRNFHGISKTVDIFSVGWIIHYIFVISMV